ncbi:hypothetical protein Q1695_008889 [Nippostrongylus brasiliensis]|nr:hypothetical protein Q1695_008889 [Nippostrongylus brasiliensis]
MFEHYPYSYRSSVSSLVAVISRCSCRYALPQVARSGLHGRCLQAAHSKEGDCGAHCMDNVLLCSNRGNGYVGACFRFDG